VKQSSPSPAAIALAAPVGNSYSLESRAAIGAHHLCSGLWVVGRVTPRSAKDILAPGHRAVPRISAGIPGSRFASMRRGTR
jgi:hypothetical protein